MNEVLFWAAAYILGGLLSGVIISIAVETSDLKNTICFVAWWTLAWIPMAILGLTITLSDEIRAWKNKR